MKLSKFLISRRPSRTQVLFSKDFCRQLSLYDKCSHNSQCLTSRLTILGKIGDSSLSTNFVTRFERKLSYDVHNCHGIRIANDNNSNILVFDPSNFI